MRTISICLLLPFLGAGCLSPGTIKPIAGDNLANIQHLRSNNQIVYQQYRQLVAATGHLELLHRMQAIAKVLNGFADSVSGAAKAADLTNEVAKLSSLVEANKKIMSNEELTAFKQKVALENPVIGDIASEFMTMSDVQTVIPVAFTTLQSQLAPHTKVEAAQPYLSRFYLAKSWKEALDDTLDAADKYIALLNRQAELAEGHAKAFVTFSESKANFSDTAGRLLSDTDLQTSIGQLVAQNTNDPKRKAAAENLLKSLSNISDATSDPNLKK